ncbi:MAG: hypothetical protein MUD01_16090 [Chloroflexaceae bacterium]|jgi:Na+/melibiose symporter-like transporter|nr:hypothetical protein [Chloroflexaceae bacterium]
MNPRQLQQHVQLLGWLYIIGHVFFLAIGGLIFFFLTSIGALSGDPQALQILGLVGTFVGLLMTLLALPGMAAGYGLLKHHAWGRMLALVVGALNLLNFPAGTALGVYTFYVLVQPEAAEYFTPTPQAV